MPNITSKAAWFMVAKPDHKQENEHEMEATQMIFL
jgi:hypothetical protein